MNEVKKLIITRKKIDQNGNEYALMKITSNLQKSPVKRIIQFKRKKINNKSQKEKERKEPKIIKEKKEKEKKIIFNKNFSSNNIYNSKKISFIIPKKDRLTKNNIKVKRNESPNIKSSKFESFISTFNTPSKGKNSFLNNTQKYFTSVNEYNMKYFNSPVFNNYSYINSSENEYENLRTKENLSKKILILSRKNKECFEKINNMQLKNKRINNIIINRSKEKEEFIKFKKKEKYEFQFKKQLLSEIKEINKYKKQAIEEIRMKENELMKNNIKKENREIKRIIEKSQKMNYQKKREKYLKIRNEEKKQKKLRQNLKFNLLRNKKGENYITLTKAEMKMNKEIKELKEKYEKLKMVNTEYSLILKKNKNNNFQRTFTPSNINKYLRNYYINIERFPRIIFDNESYQSEKRNNISKNNQHIYYNNSII